MHSCGHRSALPSAAYSLLCYHLHTLVLVLCNGHSHFIHSTNILGVFPSCWALRSVLEIWSSPGGDEIDKRQFISIKITTVHLVSQARTRMSSLIPLCLTPCTLSTCESCWLNFQTISGICPLIFNSTPFQRMLLAVFACMSFYTCEFL